MLFGVFALRWGFVLAAKPESNLLLAAEYCSLELEKKIREFWQQNGMMVEWRQQAVQTGSNLQTNTTQLMIIHSSSIWAVPEFPAPLAATSAIFAISAAIGMLVYGRRRQ